jgi:hypothetical protein
MKRVAIALTLALATTAAADPPDGVEQEFLWQVNLARSDPGGWGQGNGLGSILDAFPAKPPLAWNATLVDSAQFKTQEFIDRDYFAHVNPDGVGANALIINGYNYPMAGGAPYIYFGPVGSGCDFGCSYAPSAPNTGVESLASSFAVDGGLTSTPIGAVRSLLGEICDTQGTPDTCGTDGHRRHLLGAATFTAPMIESGAGHAIEVEGALTTHYWVFHTGFPAGSQNAMPRLLTGVAYADGDGDGEYDAGEGLAGVTVTANAQSTTTNAVGGWSLAVASGTYDVGCSGGSFAATATANDVVVAGASREVDCISGEPDAIVDFAPEPSALLASAAALAPLIAAKIAACRTSRSPSRARTSA